MKLGLDVKTADEIPVYKGESSVECLLLNPCDGWHSEHIYFHEDGDFCSFSNFTQDKEYIPNKDFIAWAELPCPLSVMKGLTA